jgi:ABC-type nickel/cobalt efflux system permease component RcnA
VSRGNSLYDKARSVLADLANASDEPTPGFIVFAIGVALLLGAAHALQPGHGKTVVAAYLVGSRGTPRHALFLGATVTATHTAGVYALGAVTLFLSQYVLPERLYPLLEVLSGLLVVGIGVWLFGQRLLVALGIRHDRHHHHDGHHHHHHHHNDHHHHGGERASATWRSLLALGISGGLLPCPEALLVLLLTIAAHRVLFGLLLIVAFSTGLAAVLVGFGLLLVYARGLFSRLNLTHSLLPRLLPVASALVIVIAGGVITTQAFPQVL